MQTASGAKTPGAELNHSADQNDRQFDFSFFYEDPESMDPDMVIYEEDAHSWDPPLVPYDRLVRELDRVFQSAHYFQEITLAGLKAVQTIPKPEDRLKLLPPSVSLDVKDALLKISQTNFRLILENACTRAREKEREEAEKVPLFPHFVNPWKQRQSMMNTSPQLEQGVPNTGVQNGVADFDYTTLEPQAYHEMREQYFTRTHGSKEDIPHQEKAIQQHMGLAVHKRTQQVRAAQARAQAQANSQIHMNLGMQNQMGMQGANPAIQAQRNPTMRPPPSALESPWPTLTPQQIEQMGQDRFLGASPIYPISRAYEADKPLSSSTASQQQQPTSDISPRANAAPRAADDHIPRTVSGSVWSPGISDSKGVPYSRFPTPDYTLSMPAQFQNHPELLPINETPIFANDGMVEYTPDEYVSNYIGSLNPYSFPLAHGPNARQPQVQLNPNLQRSFSTDGSMLPSVPSSSLLTPVTLSSNNMSRQNSSTYPWLISQEQYLQGASYAEGQTSDIRVTTNSVDLKLPANNSSQSATTSLKLSGEHHRLYDADGRPLEDSLATSPNLRELTIPKSRGSPSQKLPALQYPHSPSRDESVGSHNQERRLPGFRHISELSETPQNEQETNRLNGYPHLQSMSSIGDTQQLSISSPVTPLSTPSPHSANNDIFLRSGQHLTLFSTRKPL